MLARSFLSLLIVSSCALGIAAAADKDSSAFDQFKKLAGEWTGNEIEDSKGKPVHIKYHVTSGGSAVVETYSPGGDEEMVTVIHPDGKDLLLTHYCLLGNQPQMKAPAQLTGNQVAFTFVRATNLASDKDMYMHDVTFTFEGPDSVKAVWTHYHDGKPAGTATFNLKRKK
jgi:hypothetical protein